MARPINGIRKVSAPYIERLKLSAKSDDTEGAHCYADEVLCDLLIELGYTKVVEAYHEVDKWYA